MSFTLALQEPSRVCDPDLEQSRTEQQQGCLLGAGGMAENGLVLTHGGKNMLTQAFENAHQKMQ